MKWQKNAWFSLEEHPIWEDRALLHGFSLFETMHATSGKVNYLSEHLSRMNESCERLGWNALPFDEASVSRAIQELLISKGLHEHQARVRLTYHAGKGTLKNQEAEKDALIWLQITPFPHLPESMKLMISSYVQNERSALSGLKCGSYAERIIALNEGREHQCDEVVFLNTQNELCEAALANLFIVKNGTVITSPLSSGCLPGIIRAKILKHSTLYDISSVEKKLILDDLLSADEVFLTSSILGIMPVTTIHDAQKPIWNQRDSCDFISRRIKLMMSSI